MKEYIKERSCTNHAFSWTNHAFVYKKTNESRCNLDKSRMQKWLMHIISITYEYKSKNR